MILQKELRIHIIYWLLYDPGDREFASSQCSHPGEFANFIKKMLMPGGNRGEEGMVTGGLDLRIRQHDFWKAFTNKLPHLHEILATL